MNLILAISFTLAFACVSFGASPTEPKATTLLANVPETNKPTTIATSPNSEEPDTSTIDSMVVDDDETISETNAKNNTTDEDDLVENKSITGNSDINYVADPSAKDISSDTETGSKIVTDHSSHAHHHQSKLPLRLNMSQIDQIYVNGRKDEQETIELWHKISNKVRKSVGGLIGSMVPMMLNMSQEAKISSNCSGSVLKWILSMNHLRSWALRMLDASGKPIAGLLEGSMTMFGNYRQCLKIRAPDEDEIEFSGGEFREYFRGKYCVIQGKPWLPEKSRFYNLNTKLKGFINVEEDIPFYDQTIFDELSDWILAFNFVNMRMDICVPSLCTIEDLQKAVNFLLQGIDFKARVLRCETDPIDNSRFGPSLVESSVPDVGLAASTDAESSQDNLVAFTRFGWILVPIFAVLLVLLATVISMTLSDDKDNQTKLSHTIKSLSLKRSFSSHLNIDYDQLAEDKPLALYGLRFVLVMWIILVESAVNLKFEYLRELLMLKDLIFWWPMQIFINSSLQFDSIILLTAFTMSYKNCLNDAANTAKTITRYVLDKYIRLMPSIMVMVALVIVLPYLHRGPVWNDYVVKQAQTCQSMGWLNTVFLQNYLPYKDICLPQTWLVCVEFQLILLFAPIVYYLNKNYSRQLQNSHPHGNSNNEVKTLDIKKPLQWLWTAPGAILVSCIIFGIASSFYSVYSNNLPPSWFYTMADPDSKALYFSGHLTQLWTHLAVFALGIIAGVECRRLAKNSIRGFKDSNFHGFVAQMNKGSSNSSTTISMNNPNNSSRENINENRATHKQRLWSLALDLLGCLVAFTTMAAIIFSAHDWSTNDLPQPVIAGIYDAGSRFLWSLAFIWILYMVSVPKPGGEFSAIARALGHPIVVSLGKLSFLIYLIHPFIHTLVLAIQEQPIYSSWLMLFHILIGNITIIVILSFLMSIFVEMPCRNLFRRCGTSLLLTQTGSSFNNRV